MPFNGFVEMPIDTLALLTQFGIILAVGIIAKAISNKTKMPFVVLLIIFGTIFASVGILSLELFGNMPDFIRILALIIIVFSAGFHLKLKEVQADSKLILSLATLVFF